MDQDVNNYCRTTNFAFERDFRRGLDVLVRIRNAKIGVAAPVMVSQLCNHKGKEVQNFPPITCDYVWQAADELNEIFDHGICGSITADCSDTRVTDAYVTWKAYKDILSRVVNEYAAVATRSTIPYNFTFGTGGFPKARGVEITFSDALGRYKFKSNMLSNCDCFHANTGGQHAIADILWNGLTCTTSTPCCNGSVGTDVDKGLCRNVYTDGRILPGFW